MWGRGTVLKGKESISITGILCEFYFIDKDCSTARKLTSVTHLLCHCFDVCGLENYYFVCTHINVDISYIMSIVNTTFKCICTLDFIPGFSWLQCTVWLYIHVSVQTFKCILCTVNKDARTASLLKRAKWKCQNPKCQN